MARQQARLAEGHAERGADRHASCSSALRVRAGLATAASPAPALGPQREVYGGAKRACQVVCRQGPHVDRGLDIPDLQAQPRTSGLDRLVHGKCVSLPRTAAASKASSFGGRPARRQRTLRCAPTRTLAATSSSLPSCPASGQQTQGPPGCRSCSASHALRARAASSSSSQPRPLPGVGSSSVKRAYAAARSRSLLSLATCVALNHARMGAASAGTSPSSGALPRAAAILFPEGGGAARGSTLRSWWTGTVDHLAGLCNQALRIAM